MVPFLQRCALVAIFCLVNAVFFLAAWKVQDIRTPTHRVLQQLSGGGVQGIKRALFSPDDNVQDILITLIEQEREYIAVAVFSLTNAGIVRALSSAHERGVVVEVVADEENSLGKYSKVCDLVTAGLPVWFYGTGRGTQRQKCKGIMHHKFAVFKNTLKGQPILWTGSFNFTRSANDINQENVIVVDDDTLIKAFLKQFEVLKARCTRQERVQHGVQEPAWA